MIHGRKNIKLHTDILVHANINQLLLYSTFIDYWTVLFMCLNSIHILDGLSEGDVISFFDFKSLHQNPFFFFTFSNSWS
jgi:hypothetical protein